MRLRYQIAGLLAIPLTFELLFAASLLWNLSYLDRAVSREAKAKKVISICLELRSNLLRYNTVAHVSGNFLDPLESAEIINKTKAAVKTNMQELEALVQDNAAARKITAEYERELKQFEELLADLTLNMDGLGLKSFSIDSARFIVSNEAFEEMTASFRKSVEMEERLRALYTPLVRDFQPEALRQRAQMRTLAITSVVGNCLIVVILGIIFSKSTLHRLSVLMENIARFRRKEIEMQQVGGTDELSDLDAAFRQMVDERTRTEAFKQSIYGMISHDMRTPLSSVRLSLEILQMTEKGLAEKSRARLKVIDSEVQRVIRIANTFLDLERMEEGKVILVFDWCEVEKLIEQAGNACFSLLSVKKITLNVDITDADLVNCDEDRIVQVLINLLSNAAKFSPDNGSVSVRVRMSSNGTVRFEIEDQGPGIPRSEIPKMFKRFSQLAQEDNTKKAGTGLGLYICKMLVEAHRGEIGVEAGSSSGACFWFEIPHNGSVIASGPS